MERVVSQAMRLWANRELTLHVPLPFKYNECVTLRFSLFIFNYPYAFNLSVHLKLSSQVFLGRFLGLRISRGSEILRRDHSRGKIHTSLEMNNVLYGSPAAFGSSFGLSVGRQISASTSTLSLRGLTVLFQVLFVLLFLFLGFLLAQLFLIFQS